MLLNNELYLESNAIFEAAIASAEISNPDFLTIALIGIDDFMAVPFEAEFSDIYLDRSYSRVYLSDASTWEEVTKKELQRPILWSGESISVARFDGALTAQKWVYVVGPDNQVNSEGVPV